MPLRALIKSSPEMFSDMLLAAEDRCVDAEELLLQQRFDGCVYLAGYAVEMWLKAACLRLRSVPPGDPVKAALPALKAWMKVRAPAVVFNDFHDLEYLVQCIMALRGHLGRPLPASVQSDLHLRIVGGVYPEWIVDMRYRRTNLTEVDAWSAMANAWWMKQNWMALT